MDYNRLLYEYKDTQHYLYADSNKFIEDYYEKEADRITSLASVELEDNLVSLSDSFKVSALD